MVWLHLHLSILMKLKHISLECILKIPLFIFPGKPSTADLPKTKAIRLFCICSGKAPHPKQCNKNKRIPDMKNFFPTKKGHLSCSPIPWQRKKFIFSERGWLLLWHSCYLSNGYTLWTNISLWLILQVILSSRTCQSNYLAFFSQTHLSESLKNIISWILFVFFQFVLLLRSWIKVLLWLLDRKWNFNL